MLDFPRVVGNKVEELGGRPKKRECWVAAELRAQVGTTGWPLSSVKVRQVMDLKSRSGWRVEEILINP